MGSRQALLDRIAEIDHRLKTGERCKSAKTRRALRAERAKILDLIKRVLN